jgi:hypothetical protein
MYSVRIIELASYDWFVVRQADKDCCLELSKILSLSTTTPVPKSIEM